MTPTTPARMDVTLVTGHLGSGKTTLLERQLARPDFPRKSTGLIINDAGPVNIDARVLRGRAARIAALTGGCACCTTPRQLVEELLRFAATPGIERVWIEASGVAEPGDLLERLTDTDLLRVIHPRAVVHVIDGCQLDASFFAGVQHKEHVRFADVVVLSRVDLLTPERVKRLCGMLAKWNPEAVIIPSARGDGVLPETDGARALGGVLLPGGSRHAAYRSVFLEMPEPVDRPAFLKSVRKLPQSVERAKGFLRFTDEPGKIHFFQYTPASGQTDTWRFGADDVPLGVVCIGKGLDPDQLGDLAAVR